MNKVEAKKTIDMIFQDVFERPNPFTLEESIEKFAYGIPLPHLGTCMVTGKPTWIEDKKNTRPISREAVIARNGSDDWILPKQPINNIDDVLRIWNQVNSYASDRHMNSTEVSESDNVFNSSYVYRSASVFDSKNIVACSKVFNASHLLGCRDNGPCTFGIQIRESDQCSSSFEVSWSLKASKCMYVHDSADVYECLFSSHLRGKRYCIANMQFTKEEYYQLKPMIVDYILSQI